MSELRKENDDVGAAPRRMMGPTPHGLGTRRLPYDASHGGSYAGQHDTPPQDGGKAKVYFSAPSRQIARWAQGIRDLACNDDAPAVGALRVPRVTESAVPLSRKSS